MEINVKPMIQDKILTKRHLIFLFANIFFYYTLTTRKFINGRFINGFREKQRGRRQSGNQKFKILPLSQKNRFNLFENIASYSDFRPFAGVVRNVCF